MGFIDYRPPQNLRTKGLVCSKSAKKIYFKENSCYLSFSKRLCYKKRDFSWIKRRMEVQ